MWLDHGKMKLTGKPEEVVAEYLSAGAQGTSTWTAPEPSAPSAKLSINRVRVLTANGTAGSILDFSEPFDIEIEYELFSSIRHLAVGYQLFDIQGNTLWESWDVDSGVWNGRVREPGTYISACRVPAQLLRPGRYSLTISGFIPKICDFAVHHNILFLQIADGGCHFDFQRQGLTTPILDWTVEKVGDSALSKSMINEGCPST